MRVGVTVIVGVRVGVPIRVGVGVFVAVIAGVGGIVAVIAGVGGIVAVIVGVGGIVAVIVGVAGGLIGLIGEICAAIRGTLYRPKPSSKAIVRFNSLRFIYPPPIEIDHAVPDRLALLQSD